jgi:lipid-A-disaccharide synthase
MKKIFVLTGEPSGDILASEVIKQLKTKRSDLEFLSVGGTNLDKLGIETIYDQKEITYIAFTDILLNFFKIKRKIKYTVNEVLKFNPDILFSVDSPDFTLRVAKQVKEKNPKIKIIHFIAPKVWAWREGRVKKMKKFLDHILLLFKFEKEYFDKEKLTNTFVGHPLLDKKINENIQIDQFLDKKNIISIFPGSRISEINHHMPILINFIKKMMQLIKIKNLYRGIFQKNIYKI